VKSGNSHRYGESCIVKTTEPRCCDIVDLARNELQTLLHEVRICNQEILFLPFSFWLQPYLKVGLHTDKMNDYFFKKLIRFNNLKLLNFPLSIMVLSHE
jgi:hypothetical protein